MSSDDHATDHAGPPATEVDSDEEEFGGGAPDELYDDALDDKDERWLQQQQTRGAPAGSPSAASPALNCPLCFTTLVLPSMSQRHEVFNQWRAVFVRHCIGGDDILEDPCDDGARRPTAEPSPFIYPEGDAEDISPPPAGFLRPIMCGSCSTKVAVLDADEVFHFFHVIPG